MGYEDLNREQLARLLPELMLSGHMMDRAGMPYAMGIFGVDGQTQIAIEEWMGASPNYTRRLREALGVTGDTVEDIFKILQFDIGAPPQFLDFRYSLSDPYHGEFRNDYCGALIDVEPMGVEVVRAMCHTIQDPTFDATAIATNPKARFRPIHRPPREPADRAPHCHWSITVEPDREDLPFPPEALEIAAAEVMSIHLDPIDPCDDGLGDYTGPLFTDIRFDQWSRSALIRLAEEIAIEHHLLSLAFERAVRRRGDDATATDLMRKQFTGTAAVGSTRIKESLGLGASAADLATVLELHPTLKPFAYTGVTVARPGAGEFDGVQLRIPSQSAAVRDRSWLATLSADELSPIEAMAVGVDPHWCDLTASTSPDGDLLVDISWSNIPARQRDEVALTYLSHGATWEFEDRGIPLTITPINTATAR
jgi:hypothetical protein